jgi:hypothetical protein
VTAEEWTASDDPDELLDAAKAMTRLPDRKARLFAGGCFRLVWDLIRADDIRLAVDMADSRADKKIGQPELERRRYPMTVASDNVRSWLAEAIQSLATSNLNASHVAWQVRTATQNNTYLPNRPAGSGLCGYGRPRGATRRPLRSSPATHVLRPAAWASSGTPHDGCGHRRGNCTTSPNPARRKGRVSRPDSCPAGRRPTTKQVGDSCP